jgi:hypothetical protein
MMVCQNEVFNKITTILNKASKGKIFKTNSFQMITRVI